MANLRNSQDLKKLVLQHCGEVTDGTSSYDTIALAYLNTLYQGLIAGGNEFGIDVSEPWDWARSKYPIAMKLYGEISAGTISLTQNSFAGTFSTAPVDESGANISVEGWHIKTETYDDVYIVRSHTAGATSFSIDQAFIGSTASYNYVLMPLEYDIADDTVIVSNEKYILDFTTATFTYAVSLTKGVYTPDNFASHVVTQLTSAGVTSPTCTYNSITRKFTLGQGGPTFTLLCASGSNFSVSAWSLLGFDTEDQEDATSYVSNNPLNAIQRFCAPFVTYRTGSVSINAPEDSGKIEACDYNTLLKKHPVNQMTLAIPERFAIVRHNSNGSIRVRFSSYPNEDMRVEIPYIPVALDLIDNTSSVPLVPRSFREYLTNGACYFLMMDKSDNRAESYAQLAVAKLKAMINDARSHRKLGSHNFGRLIPRSNS